MTCTNYLMAASMAMALAACGGGGVPVSAPAAPPVVSTPSATIGGTVSGLSTAAALLLTDNGTDTIAVGRDGTFTFDAKIAAGAAYDVAMVDQPTYSYCTLANGTGKVDALGTSVANIAISCQPGVAGLLPYHVGVTVTGLAAGKALGLLNNGTDPLLVQANGLSLFPKTYVLEIGPVGGNYAVTIAANPSGQTCSVNRGSGSISSSPYVNFVNIAIACV